MTRARVAARHPSPGLAAGKFCTSPAIAFRGMATPLTVTGGMATRSGEGAVLTGAGPCSCGCSLEAARSAAWLMTRVAMAHSAGCRRARRPRGAV